MVSTVFLPRLLRMSLELGTRLYQEKGSPHSLHWAHPFFFFFNFKLEYRALQCCVSFHCVSIFPCPRLDAYSSILRLKLVIHVALRHALLSAFLTSKERDWGISLLQRIRHVQLLYLPWHWSGSTGYGRHAVQEATSWAPFLLVCSKYTLDCLSLVDKLSAFRNVFSCTTLFPDWTDLPLTSATALGSLYKSSQHTRYIHQPWDHEGLPWWLIC